MPGSLRSPTRNSLLESFSVLLAIAYTIGGCSGTEETERQEIPAETMKDFIARYEKTFDPSQLEVHINDQVIEEQSDSLSNRPGTPYVSVLPETTDGFRVQVITTQDIDQAIQLRDTLSAALPDDWVYVVYDAPSYKVRVGNFIERPAANKMVRILVEKGYVNAWVVPDLVLKNPPRKPPPPPPPLAMPDTTKTDVNQNNH